LPCSGFISNNGQGTLEYHSCIDRVDITTGTLGKTLSGASGGCTSAKKEIVSLLRQRSRPYLFSSTLAPPVVARALRAIELIG
jgi:glycine C-acetyltransferase